MRYLYTDPLKAGWMSREFNLLLMAEKIDKTMRPLIEINPDYLFFILGLRQDSAKQNLYSTTDVTCNYYLHPDCHEMLKPQLGDIGKSVISVDTQIALFDTHEIDIGNKKAYWSYLGFNTGDPAHDPIEIIQRNGKAFFMPEKEE